MLSKIVMMGDVPHTLVAVDGEVVVAPKHCLAGTTAVHVASDVLVVLTEGILTDLIKLTVLTSWEFIIAFII